MNSYKKGALAALTVLSLGGGFAQAAAFADGEFAASSPAWTFSNQFVAVWDTSADDSTYPVWTTRAGAGDSYVAAFTGQAYLSQAFDTIVGQQYSVSFQLLNTGLGLADSFVAIAGNTLPDIKGGTRFEALPGQTNAQWSGSGTETWQPYSFDFVATQTTSTLRFEALAVNNAFGLDGVTVAVAAVPEPATTSMMLLGLAGLGLMARRKKSAS